MNKKSLSFISLFMLILILSNNVNAIDISGWKDVDDISVNPNQVIGYTLWYNVTGIIATTVWVNDTYDNINGTYLSSNPAFDSHVAPSIKWVFTDVAEGNYSIDLNITVKGSVSDGDYLNNSYTVEMNHKGSNNTWTTTIDWDDGYKNKTETSTNYSEISNGDITNELGIRTYNFDNETEGNPSSDWTSVSYTNFEVDDTRYKTAPYSFWINNGGAGGDSGRLDLPFAVTSEPVEYYYYFSSTSYNHQFIFQATAGGLSSSQYASTYRFGDDGKIYYSDGVWQDSGYTYTTGWHHIRIINDFVLDTFDMWYDGLQVLDDADFTNNKASALTFQIYGNGPEQCWLDDFKIGDYQTGDWTSKNSTAWGKFNSTPITSIELNLSNGGSNRNVSISILNATDNSTITSTNLNHTTSITLTSSDFNNGFSGTNQEIKIRIFFNTNGSNGTILHDLNITIGEGLNVSATNISNTVSSIVVIPDFTLEKTVSHTEADKGDVITYKLYANNTGTDTATVIWLNDTLDTDLQYISGNIESMSGQNMMFKFTNIVNSTGVIGWLNVSIKSTAVDGQIIFNNFTGEWWDSTGNNYTGDSTTASTLIVVSGEGLRVDVSAVYHDTTGDLMVMATITEDSRVVHINPNITAFLYIFNLTSTIVNNESMNVYNAVNGIFNYTNNSVSTPYTAMVLVNNSGNWGSGSSAIIPFGEHERILNDINDTVNRIETKVIGFWNDFNNTWSTWTITFSNYWNQFNLTDFSDMPLINSWFNTTWNMTVAFERNMTVLLGLNYNRTDDVRTRVVKMNRSMHWMFEDIFEQLDLIEGDTTEIRTIVANMWKKWNVTSSTIISDLQTQIDNTNPEIRAKNDNAYLEWLFLNLWWLLFIVIGLIFLKYKAYKNRKTDIDEALGLEEDILDWRGNPIKK